MNRKNVMYYGGMVLALVAVVIPGSVGWYLMGVGQSMMISTVVLG